MIKYVLFDVAGTLLGKPSLFEKIRLSLIGCGHSIDLSELKFKHKMVSEVIHFPDRTDEEFYQHFNSELLRSLGIVPNEEILRVIFTNCTYLPWEKFPDTNVLHDIALPMGIISNFNTSLKEKVNNFFGPIFRNILVSEELGVAKPNLDFYAKTLDAIGCMANEVLYIGDSIKLDIEPATKLGIESLLIDRDNFYSTSRFKIKSLKQILDNI